MWTSDPVWDAERYAEEQDRRLARMPVCDCPALHYKDIWLCGECVRDNEEYYEEALE